MNRPRSRSQIFFILTILVFVVVPFLFWRGTWFGAELTDAQMREYLADRGKPRNVQHALAQIEKKISENDRSAAAWYPDLLQLGGSPFKEVRTTLAWVMGQDNSYAPFHDALLKLVRDSEPMVRRNAALSLVRFSDVSGKGEILAMLHPYPVLAGSRGSISLLVAVADICEHGALLARIAEGERITELKAPISGVVQELSVRNGDTIAAGEPILTLRSDEVQIWEALRALYLIGRREDLGEISSFTSPQYPTRIRLQAQETVEQVRKRNEELRMKN